MLLAVTKDKSIKVSNAFLRGCLVSRVDFSLKVIKTDISVKKLVQM